jgi:beta-galactosidase
VAEAFQGILRIGEYPYYRDSVDRWLPKLRVMRRVGIDTVSMYVPWRHHERRLDTQSSEFRFDGPGNRDLGRFLESVQDTGLFAVVKPGPFVHAELPFGGLPDRVSPSNDESRTVPITSSGVSPTSQRLVLPSMFDAMYQQDAREWLRACGDFIRPFVHPDGPVIAVQIGNEGVFGDAAILPSERDHSEPALNSFSAWLASSASDRVPTNQRGASAEAMTVQPPVEWDTWCAETLVNHWMSIEEALDLNVPAFVNVPPPSGMTQSLDAWVTSVRPEMAPRLTYGYTNWLGSTSRSEDALLLYAITARRARGLAVEENWSLLWKDAECKHGMTPVANSVLGLANGSRSVSIYTACATNEWDADLRIDHTFLLETEGDAAFLDPPYGGGAPIDVEGQPTANFDTLRVLAHFLAGVGHSMSACEPERGMTILVHPPYSSLAARNEPGSPHLDVASTRTALVLPVRFALEHGVPFSIAPLDHFKRSNAPPAVVSPTMFFMPESIQESLGEFAEAGGRLLLIGDLPLLDEILRPCRTLTDHLDESAWPSVAHVDSSCDPAEVMKVLESWVPRAVRAKEETGLASLQFRTHSPDKREEFIFLFNRDQDVRLLATDTSAGRLRVALPSGGCAIIYRRGRQLAGIYVKGLNPLAASTVIDVSLGDAILKSESPCDLSVVRNGHAFSVVSAQEDEVNRISLPDGTRRTIARNDC